MKRFGQYFSLAWANILQNKLFALFSFLVSALTCVFIYVLLQIAALISNDYPPFSHADRVVSLTDEFYDTKGQYLGGIFAPYIASFVKSVPNCEERSICNTEYTSAIVGNNLFPASVGFVDHSYFVINDFEFLAGRPFTQQETWDVDKKAVISEKIAQRYFNKTSALGEKIEIQGNVYTVIGVVKDYSIFSTTKDLIQIWLPYSTNKFMPSGNMYYTLDIQFPANIPKEKFKQDLAFALKNFFKAQGRDLDISADKLMTLKELRLARYGNNGLYIGVGVIVVLLLLIPAINIITLSESSIQNRVIELAVRRAIGARKLSIFKLLLFENFIVVGAGFIVGLMLTYPVVSWIETAFFNSVADGTSATLLAGMNGWLVNVLIIVALCIIFSLISGGIPAYMVTKQNISVMLKGGSND